MSLLLAIAAVAALFASAGGGFFVASRRKPRPGSDRDQSGDDRAPSKAASAPDPFEGLPLSLGDVIVVDHEERWLAGGLLAKEGDRIVAAVFFAPEGAATKAVAAFARRRAVFWLTPAHVDSPSEPPAALEIGGSPMERRSRLPVAISRHGQGVPQIGETAIFAEYEGGADEVAVLVTSEGRAFAWTGRKLDEGAYDRLGSGGEG